MTALQLGPPRRRRARGLRALVRFVGALASLLVLLVGVPLLLLRYGDWPITSIPTWEQVRDLPTLIVSEEAIPAVLSVAPWATWALFVCCVAAEAVGQFRGREGVEIVEPLKVRARGKDWMEAWDRIWPQADL